MTSKDNYTANLYEQYLIVLTERDNAVEACESLTKALNLCASAAGHPNAAQACRNIIRIVKDATTGEY